MINEEIAGLIMRLFGRTPSGGNWSWLRDEDKPWLILRPDSERGIFMTIIRLVGEEGQQLAMAGDVDESRGPVFIHEGANVGTNVRFEGPVYVEDGAEIRHGAYLRPGTYVSSGCVVGHCSEIKNTLMLPSSKAPHFNYVGDSILGYKSNLGAGAKLSNVRFDRGNIPIQTPVGERIDSGMKKFGALVGDLVEIGCNVVTNPGSIITPESAVPPNTVVTGFWKE